MGNKEDSLSNQSNPCHQIFSLLVVRYMPTELNRLGGGASQPLGPPTKSLHFYTMTQSRTCQCSPKSPVHRHLLLGMSVSV